MRHVGGTPEAQLGPLETYDRHRSFPADALGAAVQILIGDEITHDHQAQACQVGNRAVDVGWRAQPNWSGS